MEQAGIFKITLYEDKNLTFTYPDITDENTITGVNSEGETIELVQCYDIPKLDFKTLNAENNDIVNEYQIIINIDDLTQETFDLIETISNSLYGWIPVIEQYNNNSFCILTPFKVNEYNDMNTNVSHNFLLTLKPIVKTFELIKNVT